MLSRDLWQLLIRDRVVVKAVLREYGVDGLDVVRALREGRDDDVDLAAPRIDAFLSDTLHNDARLYTRYAAVGRDEDEFPFDIKGLGGVYFVQAPEYDDEGPFESLEAAELCVESNGLEVGLGRRYRRPFSSKSREAAPAPRPLSRAEHLAAQRRRQDRLEREAARLKAERDKLMLVAWRTFSELDETVGVEYDVNVELFVNREPEAPWGYRLWRADSGGHPCVTATTCPATTSQAEAARLLVRHYAGGEEQARAWNDALRPPDGAIAAPVDNGGGLPGQRRRWVYPDEE